jgi:hypothetical protein
MFQVFKLPFDCQAIFLSPHTDLGESAGVADQRRAGNLLM